MSRRSRMRIALGIGLTLGVLLLAACGDDGDETAGGDGTTVKITLQEWAVVPDTSSAPQGEVTFEIENAGAETHEFVVLETDLETTDLPTAEDGSVDEDSAGIEVVDEAEDISSGDSAGLTVNLAPGSYILLCNIVEEEESGELEAHYEMGMRTAFTVE